MLWSRRYIHTALWSSIDDTTRNKKNWSERTQSGPFMLDYCTYSICHGQMCRDFSPHPPRSQRLVCHNSINSWQDLDSGNASLHRGYNNGNASFQCSHDLATTRNHVGASSESRYIPGIACAILYCSVYVAGPNRHYLVFTMWDA